MQRTVRFGWRRTGMPVGRFLVLLAALAGLFAMHGMSDHGTMHHDAGGGLMAADGHGSHQGGSQEGVSVADNAEPAVPAVGMSAPSTAMRHLASAVQVAEIGADSASDAADSDLHAAMGLCLAVLAGLIALALRRLWPLSRPLALAMTDAGQVIVLTRARAPDPPDLHALSIHRC